MQVSTETAKATALNVLETNLNKSFQAGVFNMTEGKQVIAAFDVVKLLLNQPAPAMTVVNNETTTQNTPE